MFAVYPLVSLHGLRIRLKKPYLEVLDLLSEIPQILADVGFEAGDPIYHTILMKMFEALQVDVWIVLMRLSAQMQAITNHIAMDETFFDR